MRATIISTVMGLPGPLPGMSVAGGLRSARERGAVKLGLGPGLCQVQARLGRAQPTNASFSAPGDSRFACVTDAHIRRGEWGRRE